VDAFDYELPEAFIAQSPMEPRDAARLLDATGDVPVDRFVRDLPELVGPGDLIVLNETRVIPARLRLSRASGAPAEVLLLEEEEKGRWLALVRPARKLPPGSRLYAEGRAVVELGEALSGGRRRVHLEDPEVVERTGTTPLPPYIHEELEDPERYQTVYARRAGSAAAPTAGLHLTLPVLERCRQAGAEVATVDLSVGLDTFRPVSVGRPEDHVMHSEAYSVPEHTMQACREARRVLAVGTTTVRALETAVATGRPAGRTDLFIRPGFRFRAVDVLLTNFHLPRSSLLLMLAAFCGPGWKDLYRTAQERGYRFLSFGDAMLVGRRPTPTVRPG
jgi:S-adenosylmethionine:tRNA ribosyltransferase-isomerase